MYPKDIIERIKLPFRKDKELYSSFYKILGFYPHHIQYYEQALHHKSSSIKKQGSWINNERLEFLGDAILDAVVGDIVFRHFKGKREGFLTNTRSKIVQRETLNRLAVEIGLDKLIIHPHILPLTTVICAAMLLRPWSVRFTWTGDIPIACVLLANVS